MKVKILEQMKVLTDCIVSDKSLDENSVRADVILGMIKLLIILVKSSP